MAFRSAHARADDWRNGLERVLEQLRVGGAANSIATGPGFIYLSEHWSAHVAEIVAALKAATGVEAWVGSVGVGVIAAGVEYMDEPAMSVLIADWPADEYRIFSGKSRAPSAGERTRSGAEAAHFAIVHGDPATADMPALIEDMADKLASGFLVGGLSSARAQTVQVANDVLTGGLSGVVLSAAIPIATQLTQGCAPLATSHIVTEGERNIMIAIDGRPALDVYKEVIGETLSRDLNRAAHMFLVGLPVSATDTGDYVVRNVVGIDTKNKLIAIGAEVEPGMPIIFCRRDGDAARSDMRRMLDRLAGQLDGPPRGGIYISCLGRGEHMFGAPSAEVGMIRERFGDFPLAGFFANGEISHNRLYGYTGVLTLFR